MKQVAISLETDVASAFLRAKPQMRKKAETLVNLWLKDLFISKARAKKELFEIMQTAGKIAQANGLTPEILEQLLNEKD
ncbi:MAG: hypothetical protein COS14_13790 [Bacteroidetes bacterium CG02_land_8_20_14_3_00_31_25]|jgi:hypothetical protein|nr:hypothetical protein [Bacteroidota bacterium]NCQ56171.1 hypothetical protein [Candidatus Parcubacteria bacterium]PIV57629.1 MAG: hypothetical protein COS14_13790 [Bacteroidetes bacterium CG02_land_8_20_14_3_00_31_25]PIX36015.1 MAG: hypothetical protein COZ59_03375 [Bacteroidetes bacterium CG_4_8_14_3_um_filter_31_14]